MKWRKSEDMWMFFGLFVIVELLLLIFYFGYLTIFPLKTLEINWPDLWADYPRISQQKKLPIENKIVTHGDTVKIVLDFCKYTNAPAQTIFLLVWDVGDGHTSYETIGRNESSGTPGSLFSPSCRRFEESFVKVYKWIKPGVYWIEMETSYQVNFFRKDRIHLITETFEVKE